ncbi:MAG TPA: hypothetical protein VMR97_04055 [Acidimicrobiales bacterium]|nr:hypothetical protein [Acidimicrobiales bacterium]
MAQREDDRARGSGRGPRSAGGDFLQLAVDYAKQETLGPLKGLGRFVLLGVSGSVVLSVGAVVLLVALLRALQTETGSTFGGKLSWLPYLITAAAAVLVAGLAGWRVTKGPAARTGRRAERGS